MADRRYMTNGNNAIKYEAAPVRQPERRRDEPARKRPVEKPAARPDRRAGTSDRSWIEEAKYTVFVVATVVAVVIMCIILLRANIAYRSEKNTVKRLQNQLTEQITLNEQYSAKLNGAIDLDEIYSIATTELGMVYSEAGQTVYYNKNNEDYAIQYKDVPEAN